MLSPYYCLLHILFTFNLFTYLLKIYTLSIFIDIAQLTPSPNTEVSSETTSGQHAAEPPVEEPKKKPISLALVNVNEINIPPKESVTYNKQTQTTGSGSDRDGNCHPSNFKTHLCLLSFIKKRFCFLKLLN